MKMKYWMIIVAAGGGQRMSAECPKQYLSIAGKMVLQHTIIACQQVERLQALCVVLAADDSYWRQLGYADDPAITTCLGGEQRHQSVYNALVALQQVHADDWVLVHDAARCGITAGMINQLIDSVNADSVGGILALPVNDTVKRVDQQGAIIETLERSQLWQAQTPQMFRYGLLKSALASAIGQGRSPTDEAQVMEWAGHQVKVVPGHQCNRKLTYPEDMKLMDFYLRER